MPTEETIIKVRVDILLKQFEMLRHEAHQRLSFYVQIYQIYVVALTAVYGYIIANKHWDILLLFPFISVSLYMRLVWDQKVLFFISDYTRAHIEPWLKEAVEHDPTLGTTRRQWMIWDHYFPEAFSTFPPFYKHSTFVIFGLISVVPSIAYCFYNLFAVKAGRPLLSELDQLHLHTGSFQLVMLLVGLAFSAFLLWIADTTYRHPF